MSLYQDIYDIVKRIPVATVTSYGRIARMVNCSTRQVGYAMAATPDDQDISGHPQGCFDGAYFASLAGDYAKVSQYTSG